MLILGTEAPSITPNSVDLSFLVLAVKLIVCLQIQAAQKKRQHISAHLEGLLGADGVLSLPTAPGPAPLLNTPPAELDLFRSRLLSLTCIAGLGGLPQVRDLP